MKPFFKAGYCFLLTVILFNSCSKDQIGVGSITEDSLSLEKTFLKSELTDPYVKGEEIPDIIASIEQSLKSGGLEERNGSKLPFNFLGYDKSRAYKVYNDSFEITSYAFLAYTDLKDLNKLVNVVVTQKKNGKPGKPYLYEYTLQEIPNRILPHIATITKYKLNGVKVDVPGANFNPCIDVICNQYNNPIDGSGTSGTGGSSGGGSGGTGGTSGTGGTGSIFPSTGTSGSPTTCVTQRTKYNANDGGQGYYEVVDTWCSDGTFTREITYYLNIAFTDCCDSENVTIGMVPLSFEYIVQDLLILKPSPSSSNPNPGLPVLARIRQTVTELRNKGVDPDWCNMIENSLKYDLNQMTMGDLHDIWKMVVAVTGNYNLQAKIQRDERIAQYMMAIFSPDNVGIILSFPIGVAPQSSPVLKKRITVYIAKKATTLCSDLSKGFDTFEAFKRVKGEAGSGKAWHHLVEQNQITNSGFPARKIHHPDNLIKIESGFTGSLHSKITSAYATKGKYIPNMSLRDYLKGKSFEEQMEWGIKVYNEFKGV